MFSSFDKDNNDRKLTIKQVLSSYRMEADNCKQYSLRWEKHAFNLASEAGCFFEDESFLDCTLSAEGQCIEAHKIILSAASSYLSNLLKIVPDKHPVLIFNDIKFEQLKSLVAFIYNGSVNISENNIHAFLNAAQSLLIKGLSEESKEDDKYTEHAKRFSRNAEPLELRQSKKPNAKSPGARKDDVHLKNLDESRNVKKQRQILPKVDGVAFAECEESLSKLQEISFTKYIHQNLGSKLHVSHDILENKWNGSIEEKQRVPENYIVKSWKHNSVEDLNGRHKQSRNNSIKKIKLEKPLNSRNEGTEVREKSKPLSESNELPTGTHPSKTKLEEVEENIKKENAEQIVLVEPKKEIIEDEDMNPEEYGMLATQNENAVSESDSLYESRSVPNYFPQPVVDRGVPVPLLMCRTSLSEPDSIEPGWIPPLGGNLPPDHSSSVNPLDGNAQDLQCRTCAQDLPCPTCTKKYKSRYALNRHILYECGKARKSFSCDECGKKVTRQDTLQKHKLIHLVQHLKKKESKADEETSKAKKI